MNKIWIAVAVVLIAAVLLQQTARLAPTQPTPSPTQVPAVGSACTASEAAAFGCLGNVLRVLTCENGVFVETQRDCGPMTCASGTDGFGCLSNVSIFNPTPGATVSPQPSQWVYKGYCGDGVCATKESCSTCIEDCACKPGEFCDARYGAICRLKESCGDGICTDKEFSDSSCCQDCGCDAGDVCPLDNGVCVKPLYLSEKDFKPALQKRFPSGFTLIASEDYSLDGGVYKQLLVEDSMGIQWLVFINSTADIEQEFSTT